MSVAVLIFVLPLSNCSSYQSDSEGTIVDSAEHQAYTQPVLMGESRGTPSLGVIVDEKLVVLEVEANSRAQDAGIQKGDRLKTLEGISIADNREKVKEIISSFAEGDKPLSLTIEKG